MAFLSDGADSQLISPADCLRLLHFHLGSQITNIRQIKAAVIEAARIYVDLKKLGTGLTYMDVGGGLGAAASQRRDSCF